MLILGITGGHDANWCVVRDGEVLGAFEKERFSRVRHSPGNVMEYLPGTLARLGLTIRDIDLVATSEPVHRNTEAGFRRIAGRTYRFINEWEHQVVEVLGKMLPCVSIPHHLAHAAYARYTSSEPEVAVITWDGGGDFYTEDAYTSTSVSLWKGNRLEWIERVPNSDFGSLWFTYSRAVFSDPQQAGKLMGLAGYGSDRLDAVFAERFGVPQDEVFAGATTIKDCWPDYEHPPFVPDGLTWRDQQAKDIAHAIQNLTTASGLSLSRVVRALTGTPALALAGGVALNGYLNTAIRDHGPFERLWVPPAVDDGGLSVGCALFAAHHVLGGEYSPAKDFDWARLGMWYDDREIRDALEAASGIEFEQVELADAVDHTAREMTEGRAVAWVDGRAEHGPRALGGRSIISPADSDLHRTRLNAEVKFREEFRPVAPFTTRDHVEDYFHTADSPYMMFIVDGTERAAREIPAAVHIDGTARVQTVDADAPLGLIAERTGQLGLPPVLINTSFNVSEPIVNTPAQAVATFVRSPLDSMYLDGYLVSRKRP
ncbi:carbamoyltransferase C-terminal domain-containing protein [Nocardia gipuzkoensis]